MDRLITILRAAHCRSTHQYFVLDALPLIKTDGGRRLGSQLLRHYRPYLVGARAPDKEFRDFRNHVIHVQDNHWGGAATTAQKWYDQLVQSIRRSNWTEVAYNAGVLSHYFTDPLMPLHTAQSDIESVVHRPLEWSVTKSYDRILNRYRDGGHQVFFETSHGAGWLAEAVTKGAELSNRHYDELIRRYNLSKGTNRPQEGFDEESIEILAGLFGIALTGWAHIVERAAIDAHIEIPRAPLTVSSVIAAVSMPVDWILRRIESAAERKAVKAIFEEFRRSGTVTENLPDEINVVREELKRDRTAPTAEQTAKTIPFGRPVKPTPRFESSGKPALTQPAARAQALPDYRLALTDDLVDAPSIGPKTAKRFARIGITTVAHFLEASPATMADQLRTRRIKTETLVDWQDQARLVATVPGLCGYKAQLLVGAGCRDCQSLSGQEANSLHLQVQAFATSKAGQRVLRSNKMPTVEEVTQWISNAVDSPQRRSA